MVYPVDANKLGVSNRSGEKTFLETFVKDDPYWLLATLPGMNPW